MVAEKKPEHTQNQIDAHQTSRILSDAELLKNGAEIVQSQLMISPEQIDTIKKEHETELLKSAEPILGWTTAEEFFDFCLGLYDGDELKARRMATRVKNSIFWPLSRQLEGARLDGFGFTDERGRVNVEYLELELEWPGLIPHSQNVGAKTLGVVRQFVESKRAEAEQAPDA